MFEEVLLREYTLSDIPFKHFLQHRSAAVFGRRIVYFRLLKGEDPNASEIDGWPLYTHL